MVKKKMDKELDIPELTEAQINYIKSQQAKADAKVSDPNSPHFLPPDPEKTDEENKEARRTAARALMRKWEKERK